MEDRTLLLVEDNPDDEALTLRALHKNGILNPVTVAHDGAEALEYLSDIAAELPSVVLLDLKLPKINGLEVLRRLRAEPRTRCLPVIILTSSREEDDLVTAYQEGANAYVRKPVVFADFVEAVRALGLFWLVVNEPPPDPNTT